MARRRGGVSDFLTNFNAAYQLTSELGRDMELNKINKADAPETLQGFTTEQGQQLEGLAGRGYQIDFDPNKNAYVAKNAADTQTIAAQGVTDFMGKRMKGTLDADTAKTLAIADVMEKYDPTKGLQLRRDAKNQAFQDIKQGRELKKFEQEDAVTAIKKRLGEEMQAGLTDADGNTRAAGVDDYLQSTQKLAVELMKGGHTDEAGKAFKDYQAQAFTKLQLQTGERKQAAGQAAAALAAGNAAPIAEMLNKYVPGANFTDVQMGKDGSLTLNAKDVYGNAMPAQTIPSAQALAMLKSFDDPMAVYNLSLSEFQRQLQGNADKRADATLQLARNKDARENAKEGRDAAEHQGKMSVIDALGAERGMSPAQIAAVKAGVLKFPEDKADAYKVQAGDVTSLLGTPAVDKDGNPLADPMTGKQLVNRDPAKEAAFFQWMRQNNITDTNKGLAIYLGQQRGAPTARTGPAKPVDLSNVTQADWENTARKYGLPVDEVKRLLGLGGAAPAASGPAPIPGPGSVMQSASPSPGASSDAQIAQASAIAPREPTPEAMAQYKQEMLDMAYNPSAHPRFSEQAKKVQRYLKLKDEKEGRERQEAAMQKRLVEDLRKQANLGIGMGGMKFQERR